MAGFVLLCRDVLDFDLLLEVIHRVAQHQVICSAPEGKGKDEVHL